MTEIPREHVPDSTLALWREGYQFISNRCRRHHSDVFRTRLLLEPTICMRGREAAELFYDNDHFSRVDATPPRVQKTLFGRGGVQGMDDGSHRHRKAMFMSLMEADNLERLAQITTRRWREAMPQWRQASQVVLLPAVREVLCRGVCQWAGVPLSEQEVPKCTAQLAAMIDGSAALGPAYWHGKRARREAEAWAGLLISAVRKGHFTPGPEEALGVIARHCDSEGNQLDARVAAVELLNVLRPTLAVGRYVVFAALALHHNPAYAAQLKNGNAVLLEWFVQEVRRFYPFFPFVGARVREEFSWEDKRFPEGTRVLFDLYGTNHHPRLWKQPNEFHPERFRDWDGDAFSLVPQGGGSHERGHRCPGEWITLTLLQRIVQLLLEEMEYTVPTQDLSVDLSRIPAAPASGFVIERIRPAA